MALANSLCGSPHSKDVESFSQSLGAEVMRSSGPATDRDPI